MARDPIHSTHQRLIRRRHGALQMFLKRVRIFGSIVCIPIVIGAVIYGVFFSQYFSIQTIEIQAPNSLSVDELRSKLYHQLDNTVFAVLPMRNIFLFDEKKASKIISENILIENLHIQKSYPRTIRISVEGKKFELLWYTKNGVWMLGANGMLISQADQGDIASLPLDLLRRRYGNEILMVDEYIKKRPAVAPLIVDALEQDAAVGLSVIDPQHLEILMTLRDLSKKNGIETAYVLYTRTDQTITLVTREGWELIMMLDADISKQLKNASTLLSRSIKKKRSKLKSIDVRFDNRLYYTLQ